ncbi:MAG: hypothetical protein AB7O66_12865 [Limisphaerales bacterium]
MTPGIQLAAVVTSADQFWPHLTAILHWHRHAGPVQRLHLVHSDKPGAATGPASVATTLERVVRTACPGVRIERRESDGSPGGLHRQLAAWCKDAPESTCVLQFAGPGPFPNWGLDSLLALPNCRVVLRRPQGDWIELRQAPPGTPAATDAAGSGPEVVPLPPFRRDDPDEIPIADLVRAQSADSSNAAPLASVPARPIPLVPLTSAAIAAGWDWQQAFAASAPEFAAESASALFPRYVGALLLDLGLKNVVLGSRRPRTPTSTPPPPASDPLVWINQGGRLLVIDARLESTDPTPATAGANSPQTSSLGPEILRAAEMRRDLGPLAPDWLLIRPCLPLQPIEQHLAEALGIRVIDESACRELPARLAAFFGLPLSADLVEVERRLRTHLAGSGRTRAFAPEPAVLQQQQQGAGNDPVVVQADALLDQVQRARGQNWLLWIHNERIHLRVPAEGRSSASGDWRAMLGAFVGLDPSLLHARQTPRIVLLDFPDAPESRRRVADWLRPFLNASLTFDTARARFAAEARVTAEAEAAARANARPGATAGPAQATSPANATTTTPTPAQQNRGHRPPPPAQRPPSARPAPAPPPASPGPRRMQRVSLEDLDRALDSAFGPPPAQDPSQPPKSTGPANS